MIGHETGRRGDVMRRVRVTGLAAVVAAALALAVGACGGGTSRGSTTGAKTAATATAASASTTSSTTIATATNLANRPAPTVSSSSASPGGGSKSPGGGAGAAGKTLFRTTCGGCHTLADAQTSGHEGPDLDQLKPDLATVKHQVINGGGVMPAFGKSGRLSSKQVTEVAKYVSSVAGKK